MISYGGKLQKYFNVVDMRFENIKILHRYLCYTIKHLLTLQFPCMFFSSTFSCLGPFFYRLVSRIFDTSSVCFKENSWMLFFLKTIWFEPTIDFNVFDSVVCDDLGLQINETFLLFDVLPLCGCCLYLFFFSTGSFQYHQVTGGWFLDTFGVYDKFQLHYSD